MDGFAIVFGVIILVLIVRTLWTIGRWSSSGNIGKIGESRMKQYLRRLPSDEYILFHDIMVADSDGNTTQIDHVVVSRFGIFVIETKCYSGWIFGDEKVRVWTQTVPRGRGWWSRSERHTFQNPIRQNWRHIYVLAERLALPRKYFMNVVVFVGSAEFKTALPDSITNESNIITYIRSFDKLLICSATKDRIVGDIQKLNDSVSESQRANHVHTLCVKHSPPPTVSVDDEPPNCPQCGSIMRMRHRNSDNAPFYGCSHYPKCKGIVNVR